MNFVSYRRLCLTKSSAAFHFPTSNSFQNFSQSIVLILDIHTSSKAYLSEIFEYKNKIGGS